MGDYNKVKICCIENGFIVKRRGEKAHFPDIDKALFFAKLVLSESRVQFSFDQLLTAIKENRVNTLELKNNK